MQDGEDIGHPRGELARDLDEASQAAGQGRIDPIRLAVESYLEDLQDAALSVER
ncbi:MAG: hypothetical protein OXN21_08815 [Chloroflexota bacterium]|nr:hypothetical protein [Chloroflexota bacterium]